MFSLIRMFEEKDVLKYLEMKEYNPSGKRKEELRRIIRSINDLTSTVHFNCVHETIDRFSQNEDEFHTKLQNRYSIIILTGRKKTIVLRPCQ